MDVRPTMLTIPEHAGPVKIRLGDRTDGELVLLTLDGSADAFGVLVERYRMRAVRMASAIVGDWELAKDLSQDSFLKAYRALNTFDVKSPFLPWYYRILRNTCMDQIRRRGRLRAVLEKIKLSARAKGDLRDEIRRSDLSVIIRMAINRLEDKDREIIELRHFSDLSYDEIAELLDIPRGTVMSRLHYARKQLQEILESDFHVKAGEN